MKKTVIRQSWFLHAAICCNALIMYAVAAPAEEVSVRASADRSQAMIGERIRYHVVVTYPKRLSVTSPSPIRQLDDFSIQQEGTQPPERKDGLVSENHWYVLTPFTTGTLEIPSPVVRYQEEDGTAHEVRGEAVTVTVPSVLPPDWERADIRSIKPPLFVLPRWWWPAVFGLMVGSSVLLMWWRKRRVRPGPIVPIMPPHEVALQALEVLQREQLTQQGRIEEYYVKLSDIVRRYVEARFGLRAPEMTTEEFLQASLQSAALSISHRQLLRDFLEQCDLVKFARYRPPEYEARQAFDAARRFIQETRPIEALPSPVPNGAIHR